jgi:hypothetical protein
MGVSWRKDARKWQAGIMVDRKHIYLGLYDCEGDAARVYNEAALRLHGEFATVNGII